MEQYVPGKGIILDLVAGHSKLGDFGYVTDLPLPPSVLVSGLENWCLQLWFPRLLFFFFFSKAAFNPKFQDILLGYTCASHNSSPGPTTQIHTLWSEYFQTESPAWFSVGLWVASEACDICSVDHGEPWTLYAFIGRSTGTYFPRMWPSVSLISLFYSWRAWIISSLLRAELLQSLPNGIKPLYDISE